MPEPAIDVRIAGGQQFKELAKKLGDPVRRDLRLELQKEIRAAAAPVISELQQAVQSIESRSQGHGGGAQARAFDAAARSKAFRTNGTAEEKLKATHRAMRAFHAGKHGLRARIAKAIKLKIRTSGSSPGVRIEVAASGLPEDQRTLPKHLDSPKGWRHPVFGHRDAWVQQYGQPWWSVTIERHRDPVRARIIAAMHTIANKVKETL